MFWFASSLIRIHLSCPLFAFNLLTVDGCFSILCLPRELVWDMCRFTVHSLSRLDLWWNTLQYALSAMHRAAVWEPDCASKDKRLWRGAGWRRGLVKLEHYTRMWQEKRKSRSMSSSNLYFSPDDSAHNWITKAWCVLTIHPSNVLHRASCVAHRVIL